MHASLSFLAGSWLAMVITYTLSIGLSFFVVKATRKSWDYIATASLLHLILCIASELLRRDYSHKGHIMMCIASESSTTGEVVMFTRHSVQLLPAVVSAYLLG